ncbi:MAG TPA: hypothetical protein VN327_10575 [Pseudonocardiaceae bacterium]|nr:hypothetical protein [Pseudonocardiaceae bacterium]HZD14779.1 hypothetical protein [Pseudonocardiaceae bacterium]
MDGVAQRVALDDGYLLEVVGEHRAANRPAMLPPTTTACAPLAPEQ